MATRFDPKILRSPRWLLAIAVGVFLVFGFVRLGLWQLDRLDERRTLNATVEARQNEPAVPLSDLVLEYPNDVDAILYRSVSVEGVYRESDEFFSIGRIVSDVRGTLVLTPLDLPSGDVLIVVRGIVPPETAGPPAVGYETPDGTVRLVGRVDDGEEPAPIGESDPSDGVLTSINRVDLAFIGEWVEGNVLPINLILEGQTPSGANGEPMAIPMEELSDGRHLGYAIQWFAFALIVLFGVAGLVYRAGTSDPEETSQD